MKVALITGAGSGIGRATALGFLRSGDAVVALGRRVEPLESLAAEAGESSGRVAILAADATGVDTPRRAVELALSRFGRLDYLVNNAGMGHPRPLHESDDAFIDANIDLMLRAPIRFTREAVAVMERDSCIVNVSSTYGLVGGLRGGAYSAAKAGLIGLTTHVAAQYGAAGIRCNAVAPGVVETEMTRERLTSESYRRMNEEMTPAPPGKWGTADDVAGVIRFLCSDAAGWINGQCIAIDGGWSTTKYLCERALAAQRTLIEPKFTHSGRPP